MSWGYAYFRKPPFCIRKNGDSSRNTGVYVGKLIGECKKQFYKCWIYYQEKWGYVNVGKHWICSMGLLNLYILNTVNVSNLDMLRCNQVHLIWGKRLVKYMSSCQFNQFNPTFFAMGNVMECLLISEDSVPSTKLYKKLLKMAQSKQWIYPAITW